MLFNMNKPKRPRGRPRSPDPRRAVSVHLSVAELTALDAAASRAKRTRSDWIRCMLLDLLNA